MTPPSGSVSGSICVVVLCLLAGAMVQPALADAAAGRKAFESGDFARAVSEWQSAADNDDAEAQLGLGSLYEQGLGDLKQDYKRADYWYRKAAEKGSTEAQYRLALIWAAGGDNFPPDLIEAYKWAVVTVASKGVWGSAATEVQAQLDKILTGSEREAGKERAAAWRAALSPRTASTSKKEEPTSAAATLPSVVASPASPPRVETPAGGCPGWPFPTLPCTEQFPALGNTVRAGSNPSPQAVTATVKKPIDELAAILKQIDCSALNTREVDGAALIAGTVPDADQKAKVIQSAARLFPNTRPQIDVEIVPSPLCRVVAELDSIPGTTLPADGIVELRLNGGSSALRHGDRIELAVRAPAHSVNLRIDYFSLDGKVLHLLPNANEPTVQVAAGASRVFGHDWIAGGAPFGTEMIGVIASAAPISLPPRPTTEPALGYLRDLKQVLTRLPAGSATTPLVAKLLVHTSER